MMITPIIHLLFQDLIFSPVEYIVLFKDYYPERKRVVFVSEALSAAHVPAWEVIPRNNPAQQFPSDFSLIRVSH